MYVEEVVWSGGSREGENKEAGMIDRCAQVDANDEVARAARVRDLQQAVCRRR